MATRFAALFCLAVLGPLAFGAGFLFAAKECEVDTEFAFPSVDAEGNLPGAGGGIGEVKICVNTKNGKLTAKGSGQTTNESNAKQNYKNDPEIQNYYDGPLITKSRFKVAVDGACKLLLKGTVPVRT